jgi:hypothetical protein
MGVDPREITGPGAAALRLEELRAQSESSPASFAKAFNDADLDIRYWIQTMLNTGVLKTIGVKILDGETNKLVGNTFEETIFFFKDDDNSEAVSLYKARMQEYIKKPVSTRRSPARKVVTS